jgi:hypothetical protein
MALGLSIRLHEKLFIYLPYLSIKMAGDNLLPKAREDSTLD